MRVFFIHVAYIVQNKRRGNVQGDYFQHYFFAFCFLSQTTYIYYYILLYSCRTPRLVFYASRPSTDVQFTVFDDFHLKKHTGNYFQQLKFMHNFNFLQETRL